MKMRLLLMLLILLATRMYGSSKSNTDKQKQENKKNSKIKIQFDNDGKIKPNLSSLFYDSLDISQVKLPDSATFHYKYEKKADFADKINMLKKTENYSENSAQLDLQLSDQRVFFNNHNSIYKIPDILMFLTDSLVEYQYDTNQLKGFKERFAYLLNTKVLNNIISKIINYTTKGEHNNIDKIDSIILCCI